MKTNNKFDSVFNSIKYIIKQSVDDRKCFIDIDVQHLWETGFLTDVQPKDADTAIFEDTINYILSDAKKFNVTVTSLDAVDKYSFRLECESKQQLIAFLNTFIIPEKQDEVAVFIRYFDQQL